MTSTKSNDTIDSKFERELNQLSCSSPSINFSLSQTFGNYLTNFDYSKVMKIVNLNQLTSLDITVQELDENNVGLTSDKWISIHQTWSRQSKFNHQLDLDNHEWSSLKMFQPYQQQIFLLNSTLIASALINPFTNILGLLTITNHLYIFELFKNKCINWVSVSNTPQFWTWLDSQTIGLVINNLIFQWDIYSQASNLESIFKIDPKLLKYKLKDLKTDQTKKWFAVLSLSSIFATKPAFGLIQIYSCESHISQCIEGQSVTFTRYKFSNKSFESSVLVIAKSLSFNSIKLFITQLGPEAYYSNTLCLNGSSCVADFPCQVICSIKLGLIYIISKLGYLNVCDFKSKCILIQNYHITNDFILKAILDEQTQTPLIITCQGFVLSLRFKFDQFLNHLQNLSKKNIHKRISKYLLNLDREVTKL